MTRPARWKVLAYAVALFVAGAISGAMVTYHKADTSWKVGRQKQIADHIRQRLKTTLNLTPEQAQKIDPYIEKTAEQLEASHVTCLNTICAALDKMHVDIAPELSEEQKQKLEQITAERRDLMLKKYNYAPAPANPASH